MAGGIPRAVRLIASRGGAENPGSGSAQGEEGMPAKRNQRSTCPATTTRAGSTTARRGNGGTFGIAVCSLSASILPGSETSQRWHTSWHEIILGIDSRTVR
jgi:hypothetical protein